MFRLIASLEIQVIYDFYSAIILEERESYKEMRNESQRNEMCDDLRKISHSIKWICSFAFSTKNIFFYFARTALTSLFHFEDASLTGHTLKNV